MEKKSTIEESASSVCYEAMEARARAHSVSSTRPK
jgi:hypothetical protein